jgi:uncharacterized protein YbaP (TraB family)
MNYDNFFRSLFYIAPNTRTMLRIALRGGLSVLFLFVLTSCFSQNKLSKTLLWRISGNSLTKPSYLYGTMHLQDKRLFQFGDSVYNALEKTEGFAMELDVNELMDSIISAGIKKAESEVLLARQKVKLNRKKLSKGADSLLKSYGIKGEIASKKELKKIRDKRMAKLLQQGEMPTIVDAYLLGMARRMNKWTGGIEDVSDQLNLSDELGGELEPESVLMPEENFKASVEQMIAIYLSQDIDKMDALMNRRYCENDKDLVLTKRNVKMAMRMDSLSHLRSMFFAVGAAHLPGDSGVIILLRKNGYHVEPVFSSTKIPADEYASKLQDMQWQTVEADDKVYSLQMPGKPTDYNMFGDVVKMKMYYDMTTMSFYMSGNAPGYKLGAGVSDEMIKNMVQNIAGKNASFKSKTIQASGIAGKEVFTENDDASYRMQLFVKDKMLFLMMVGALKKTMLQSKDANKFFSSFAAGNTIPATKEWQTLTLEEKGISVQMPQKATLNKEMDEKAGEQDEWVTLSYNAIDPQKGFYYLLQIREPGDGFVLDGDSTYLESIKEDYKTRVDKILHVQKSNFQTYPALYMDGYLKEANAVYKTLHVTRGNRIYSLIAGAPKGADMGDLDVFLNSLQLLPFGQPVLQTTGQDGFTTSATAAFKLSPPDSTETTSFFSSHYYSTNSRDAVMYNVYKGAFSPTYWVADDSTYYHSKLSQYVGYEDSLIKKQWVQNGSTKGFDLLVQNPGYNSLKKVRLMVNGDTLYTLLSQIPVQDIDKDYHQKFFDDFRITTEVPPTIYTSKAAQLLKALQTKDSLMFEDASENLGLVTFEIKDLPLLHEALLLNYRDSGEYYSVNQKLINIVSGFADSTTEAFVSKQYPLLKNEKENLRYDLLALLAKRKTASTYSLLKQFLLQPLPSTGYVNTLQYAFRDSLELTTSLFPEVLQNAADTLFGYSLVTVVNESLDSNLISKDILMPYKSQLLAGAKFAAAKINKDENEEWKFGAWADLLAWLNVPEGSAILKEALKAKDVYLKQQVIIAMLKNNLPVSAAEITKVAADKLQRRYFYEALVDIKKQNLFPAIYNSQKSLAESDLYAYISEEYDEDVTLTYIGERTETYEGKKKLFHLYKVRMIYDDEERKQTFLGIAGPYTVNANEKVTYGDATGFYTSEEYTPVKTAKLLKAYLKDMKPAEE